MYIFSLLIFHKEASDREGVKILNSLSVQLKIGKVSSAFAAADTGFRFAQFSRVEIYLVPVLHPPEFGIKLIWTDSDTTRT